MKKAPSVQDQSQNIKELTDEKLVDIVRKGNKQIFEELVTRYQNKLVRYVTYLTGNADISNDVVQNTFIKVYINLNSFDSSLKFSSWIYRIAHNEAFNHLKKYRFQKFQIDLDFVDSFTKSPVNVESEYEKKETSNLVTQALDELPLKYREPLLLYYIDERTYDEISDILKVSINTVGTLISRGKKKLKEILAKEGKVYGR